MLRAYNIILSPLSVSMKTIQATETTPVFKSSYEGLLQLLAFWALHIILYSKEHDISDVRSVSILR